MWRASEVADRPLLAGQRPWIGGGCSMVVDRPKADIGQCISQWPTARGTRRLCTRQIVGTKIYDVDLADIQRHLCAKQAASMGIECGLNCA